MMDVTKVNELLKRVGYIGISPKKIVKTLNKHLK